MARIVTALMIVALALPAAAGARVQTIAPPGDSSASEYVESVPSDNGNRPTSSLGSHPGALTPSETQALDHAGSGGRTLVAVVNATSPSGAGAGSRGGHATAAGTGSGSQPGTVSGQGARSPVSSVLAAASGGGGGMGLALPVVMGAALLGVVSLLFLRRRRAPPPPS